MRLAQMAKHVNSRHRRTIRSWARLAQSSGHRHEGQGLAEYGLVIVLVAIAAISTLSIFGQSVVVAYYEAIVAGLPF